jgi:hypothetical protein
MAAGALVGIALDATESAAFGTSTLEHAKAVERDELVVVRSLIASSHSSNLQF